MERENKKVLLEIREIPELYGEMRGEPEDSGVIPLLLDYHSRDIPISEGELDTSEVKKFRERKSLSYLESSESPYTGTC